MESNHKSIGTFHTKAINQGQVIHLGNLHFKATKAQVEQKLKEQGFNGCTFYWLDLPDDSHKGWCHVQFADKATAERAMAILPKASINGRLVKAGPIKKGNFPRVRIQASKGGQIF
jgi:hypothetical protein